MIDPQQENQLRELRDNSLWHQLTRLLISLLSQPDTERVELFERYARPHLKDLDALSLVSMSIMVTESFSDKNEAIRFLQEIQALVSEHPHARIYCLSELVNLHVITGDSAQAKHILETCQAALDAEELPSAVRGAVYKAASEMHKVKADFAAYYRSSLLYLACIEPKRDLSKQEQLVRAHDLMLAAVLAETVYNIGELLLHPIIVEAPDESNAGLLELVKALHAGQIATFDRLFSAHALEEPILQQHYNFIRQKLCLMALLEAVFRKPTTASLLRFDEIAKETSLAPEEVEHLVMKALALNLISGKIDEVNRCVNVVHIQPKALDQNQLELLRNRIAGWEIKVQAVQPLPIYA